MTAPPLSRSDPELGALLTRIGAVRLDDLTARARGVLGARWAERGRNEHASVAAFGAFGLGLLAVGAPPELLAASHQAALDELRHARCAFALAARYLGAPSGPEPLDLEGLEIQTDLGTLARATMEEGCVGETLSLLELQVSLESAEDPALREVLAQVAADEGRHAELSWAFVRWAAEVGAPALREELVALGRHRATIESRRQPDAMAHDLDAATLARHGFLSPERRHAVRLEGARTVIGRALDALEAGG